MIEFLRFFENTNVLLDRLSVRKEVVESTIFQVNSESNAADFVLIMSIVDLKEIEYLPRYDEVDFLLIMMIIIFVIIIITISWNKKLFKHFFYSGIVDKDCIQCTFYASGFFLYSVEQEYFDDLTLTAKGEE
jgi:hypothetical protein